MELETVIIPGSAEHAGVFSLRVTLQWVCPVCGQKRGKPNQTRSYDGSRILYCDGWTNPCGHVDKYDAVREEAKKNGMNKGTFEGYEPVE